MAAVGGLCISSLVSTPYSSVSRLSSRGGVHLGARVVRQSSRKCRLVVLAVDPEVKSSASPLEQEKYNSGIVDTRLLELAEASPSSTKEPKPKPVLGLTDSDLKSSLEHRLWVAFGATAVTGMLAKALLACQSWEDVVQVAAGMVAAWVMSDLATGFVHWGLDNYGDALTPILGSQIDMVQGHHQRPWTITKREFANNIHAIARPVGIFLAPFLLLPSHPLRDSFLGFFFTLVVMSQHLHALAHMKKSQLPPLVAALQDNYVILNGKMHGWHHKPPYDANYCIVSGLWNPVLKRTQLFKRLERLIFDEWRVAPRSWSETSEEWLQVNSYFEDGTEFDPSQSS